MQNRFGNHQQSFASFMKLIVPLPCSIYRLVRLFVFTELTNYHYNHHI